MVVTNTVQSRGLATCQFDTICVCIMKLNHRRKCDMAYNKIPLHWKDGAAPAYEIFNDKQCDSLCTHTICVEENLNPKMKFLWPL